MKIRHVGVELFLMKCEIPRQGNFMKIRPVGVELFLMKCEIPRQGTFMKIRMWEPSCSFRTDRRPYGQTDMTNLIDAFHCSVNTRKTQKVWRGVSATDGQPLTARHCDKRAVPWTEEVRSHFVQTWGLVGMAAE